MGAGLKVITCKDAVCNHKNESVMLLWMISTLIQFLKVWRFEPVLEPVEPVLQVLVRGSGKVVRELDRTELQQP